MRFQKSGANIPDELISAQLRGEVVFFCGAGVSVPANLPSFLQLTQDVMLKLGVSPASSVALSTQLRRIQRAIKAPSNRKVNLPFSLDQTFYLLQQEYGKQAVAYEVLDSVKVGEDVPLLNHKTILRLARNPAGKSQVVTTNFDRLFEYADSTVQSYVPPRLPALSNGEKIEGVVYLHGQWEKPSHLMPVANNLVISSADFGRAYLAEGWASSFIKELANRYVIVLLGYSAEDPPVRYLLEGLHSQGGTPNQRIYAFARGSQEKVNQDWQYRGVTGIAYTEHKDLWNSLSLWADFSEDPSSWYQSTVANSQKPPESLEPYERGQVAFTVGTLEGARIFADATPAPPAKWLCVFDSSFRNRRPVKRPFPNQHDYFSFQENFGFEDAEFYSTEIDADTDREEPSISLGVNYLLELAEDNSRREPTGLFVTRNILPTRLFHLVKWFANVLDEPISLWWLAHKGKVSDTLIAVVENTLRNREKDNPLIRLWWNYLDGGVVGDEMHDGRLFNIAQSLKVHGWNAHLARLIGAALWPTLGICVQGAVPPSTENSELREIIGIPHMSSTEIAIPDEFLREVVASYRVGIERYSMLASEIEEIPLTDFLEEPSIHSDNLYKYVHWFKELFAKLAAYSPRTAVQEYLSWNPDDAQFFGPLRLYALSQPNLFSSEKVIEQLCSISEEVFWDNHLYVANLIINQWNGITEKDKRKILSLVVRGPSDSYHRALEKRIWNQIHFVAPLLRLLESRGCELNASAKKVLATVRRSKYWDDAYDSDNQLSRFPRIRSIQKDTQYDELKNVPIEDIVAIAVTARREDFHSATQFEPFEGLVRNRPLMAYRALVYALNQDTFHQQLWRDLLNYVPEGMGNRFNAALAYRLLELSPERYVELRYPAVQWLAKSLPAIASENYHATLILFDRHLELLGLAQQAILDSEAQAGTRKEFSLNEPIASLVSSLFDLVRVRNETFTDAYEEDLLPRLEKMLVASDKTRKVAIYLCARILNWLFDTFPSWTSSHLLPCFNVDAENSEAAWAGFKFLRSAMLPKLFTNLKKDFSSLIADASKWPWAPSMSQTLHKHLVFYCPKSANTSELLSYSEVRDLLKKTTDKGRNTVLYQLTELNEWGSRTKPFITEAWPRELRFQNSRISSAFVRLAMASGEDFPEAVATVLPFLTPLGQGDLHFYHSSRGSPSEQASRYPDSMLALLNAAVGERTTPAPYKVEDILQKIVEAKPELVADSRMRRLRNHLNQHPY
ncbi:SIR2 family protein [Herbaspirillum sp. C7C8]|uniref:SIR2 family protein n=1 Tax=Herbaspirillum sp. C7C8 TaxID=2736665 RepID=UPI001F525326|nr:SIR2 family protein [Herbaspirillum sp. C7C8]MCI1004286.1 SIR2 family protein [Herbaspirillum sp. C7C8]